MKFIVLALSIWTAVYSRSMAQDTQHIRVKAGANLTNVLSFAERYQYPEFQSGKLLFTNNSSSMARFNYNRLLGEMHFIDAKGDTLALTSDPTIQAVVIGKDLFYYEYPKQYWMLVTDYESGKLMVKQNIVLIDREKQGGYNQSTGASSIRNTTSYSSSNGSLARLNSQADMLFAKKDEYKLMDKNKKFYSANQAGFLSLYSKNKQPIKQYLKENNIDFRQESDLKKLLEFCTTLP